MPYARPLFGSLLALSLWLPPVPLWAETRTADQLRRADALPSASILKIEKRSPWYSRETGETYETRWIRAKRHRVPVILGLSPFGGLEPEEFAAAAKGLEEKIAQQGGTVRKELATGTQNCHAFALAAAGFSEISPDMWLQADDQQIGFEGSEAAYLGLLGELFGSFRSLSVSRDSGLPEEPINLRAGDFLLFLNAAGFPAHSGIVVSGDDGRLITRSKFGKYNVFDAELSIVAKGFDARTVRIYRPR